MKKSLFIFLTLLTAAFSSRAALTADWKIHMPFDTWPIAVVETPSRVYFLNRTFEYADWIQGRGINSYSLHYYDKKGDELLTVNERDGAAGNAVQTFAYNPDKGYMLVVYTDCNIEFIYDDGRTANLPALKAVTIPGKKEVNDIVFDPSKNLVYLGTTFGYVSLNDDKHEVAESRIYDEGLKTLARCGDYMLAMTESGKALYAPVSSQRFTLDDYDAMSSAPEFDAIIPFDDNSLVAVKKGENGKIYKAQRVGSAVTWAMLYEDPNILNWQKSSAGVTVSGDSKTYVLGKNGTNQDIDRPADSKGQPSMTTDSRSLWSLASRKGLRQYSRSGDGGAWSVSKDYMRPDAPATYIATSFAYHPKYGLIAGSNGVDYALNDFSQTTPANLSAMKDGFWKEYSPLYTNDTRLRDLNGYYGIAFDPKDNRYLYRGSAMGGIIRQNMEDPNDIIILANPSNRYRNDPGFIKAVPDVKAWNIICRFSPVSFDNDGRMWALHNDPDNGRQLFFYWDPADRLATTSPANYRPMKEFPVPTDLIGERNDDKILALTCPQNKNILAIASNYIDGGVVLYNHNGTPDVTSDDKAVLIYKPTDQDGGAVSFLGVNNVFEDPQTGLLWIMSHRGLFTVNPVTAFDNLNTVNRIKVARNDGTNLADYLLNEINVTHMCVDGEGRKWFATSNGIVCSSADGRTILAEFNADNSYLPSNEVYAVGYNPDRQSIMAATGGGLAEIFPSGSGNSSTGENNVRVYPNPVEPDFYGWVRIDNVADGSLVKITDAKGGIVKELGPVQGGGIEWDVTSLNNTRVSSGVYYIMVSPGSGGGDTSISKILVLN